MKTVCPLLLAIVMVTVELDGMFSSQVADELVRDVVLPLTTAVLPTKPSAWVACVVCCSETSVGELIVGLELLLDAGELDELLGELVGVQRIERVLVLQLRRQELQEGLEVSGQLRAAYSSSELEFEESTPEGAWFPIRRRLAVVADVVPCRLLTP